jgi:acetyl esterase/lipase
VTSLRGRLLSLTLRLVEKPRLARAWDPLAVRAQFERAARLFPTPQGARYADDPLGAVPALRCAIGAPEGGRTILYLHGGAYLMGSRGTHRHLAAALAGAAGATAWLPDYRVAPEHPFPAAVEDALAAWRVLLDRGADPARAAFAGDSAGGGLVFALLHAARAEGLPDPARLVAFSPWTDMTGEAAALRRNARADPLLPAARLGEVRDWVLAGADPRDPRASPVFARFDPAPPPAFLSASRTEIIADDATAMAAVLRAAGGTADLRWSDAAPHAWPLFLGLIPEAAETVAEAGAFLAEAA